MSKETVKVDVADIKDFFNKYKNSDLYYHTWEHVKTTAERALYLAKKEEVTSEYDLTALEIACYFHDIGYSVTKSEDENVPDAIILFKKYAKKNGYSEEFTEKVSRLIWATKYPHRDNYENILEAIIQDADLTQCWDWESYDILRYLKAEGNRVKPNLLFPELSDLNTKSAKRRHKVHRSEYYSRISSEIRNQATFDVLHAYREGYTQALVLQSLECLKLVKELFSE